MKITPLDIRRKEFRRSMRGYSDEEVDVFLDEVADEFERLFQENLELQDRVQRLDEQIATYAQVRDALEKTLISAQVQSEEIKANAHRESELILRDAQLKARTIVSDSYGETQQVQKALVGLKRLEEEFRFKFRSLLEGYLNLLNDASITTTAAVGVAGLEGETAGVASLVAAGPAAAAEGPEGEEETGPEQGAGVEEEPEAVSEAGPSGLIEDEIPTEETEPAVAGAAAVEEAVGITVVEAVMAEEVVVEEAAEVPTAPVIEEMVLQAAAVGDSTSDTTTTDEATLETSPGSPRPEDDQTELDDSRHGFFFGRQLEDIDDTFPGEDVIRKDRTRDFEW